MVQALCSAQGGCMGGAGWSYTWGAPRRAPHLTLLLAGEAGCWQNGSCLQTSRHSQRHSQKLHRKQLGMTDGSEERSAAGSLSTWEQR